MRARSDTPSGLIRWLRASLGTPYRPTRKRNQAVRLERRHRERKSGGGGYSLLGQASAPVRDHHQHLLARPPADRLPLSRYRVLPVAFVPAILEDEEWFGAMRGCFGERDGFSEAFKRERLALGDAQHSISDETANLE